MPNPGDPPSQLDFIFRQIQTRFDQQQRAIDDLANLLRGFNSQQIAAFDLSGTPSCWETLTRRAGSWRGIVGGGGSAAQTLQPGKDVSTNAAPKYTITYGTYGGAVPTISGTALVPTSANNIITLGATDVAVYMQCDFSFNTTTGLVTITDAEIKSTASLPVPASTISGSLATGTLYQLLFGVTITAPVGMGPYTVVAAPGVDGSQNFGVCLVGPSISGPWLV